MTDTRNAHVAEPFRSTLDAMMTCHQPRSLKAPDQSFFIVMRDFGKLGFESVTDPDMTRESIIHDIASGSDRSRRLRDRVQSG
jgi:hypothetical protein